MSEEIDGVAPKPKKIVKKKKSKLQKKIDDVNSKLWKNKCDYIWRTVCVKLNPKCEICGKTENLNVHHMIPRQMSSHRHIVKNGIVLDASCHKFSFELSPHKAPVAFFGWMFKNKRELFDWLIEQKASSKEHEDYKTIYERLMEEYKELLATNI